MILPPVVSVVTAVAAAAAAAAVGNASAGCSFEPQEEVVNVRAKETFGSLSYLAAH